MQSIFAIGWSTLKAFLFVGVFLAAVFAVVIIRFNLKRRHIARCARRATDDQLEALYDHLDRRASEGSTAAILGRTNRVAVDDCAVIPFPTYVPTWGGRTMTITHEAMGDVRFQFVDEAVSEVRLDGKVWRLLPVPRFKTKSGKERNRFYPIDVERDAELWAALAAICPKYPGELMAYLLDSGADTFEFEGCNQLRIGGNPAWIQSPEFPKCPDCWEPMGLICQFPGELLPGKKLASGSVYFFGCAQHPKQTTTVTQCS